MIARFWFTESTYIDSDIVLRSYTATYVYYNELSPADNSVKFTIPFGVAIANNLKQHINDDVKVEIIDDNVNLFYGYVRKSIGFSKTINNKSISIELVSPSFKLNRRSSSAIVLTSKTVDAIVRAVLTGAGWTLVSPTMHTISDVVPIFVLNAGDNYKEVLTELLFEYGYVFDFDEYGYFDIFPLFNSPSSPVELTDGPHGNLFGEVVQQANERRYDGISATWKNCVSGSELVFQDLSQHIAGDTIFSGSWKAEYSAPKEIIYIQSVSADITKTPAGMSVSVVNEGTRAKITFGAATSPVVSKIALTGTGFFSTASNVTKVTDGENLRKHEIKYCFDGETVEALAENIRNYYKYSGLTAQFVSSEDIAPGAFVKLTVEGQGEITCRVTRKQTTLVGFPQYEAESVTTYTPATAVTEKTGTQYASGEAATIIQAAQTLIHGVRQLASLEESGAYEDEVANYHGQLYSWKDSAWHLINRERYLGPFDHCPDYDEGSYFLAAENFADPNGTTLLVNGVEELEVDDTVLNVAASFNKGSIYVGENGAWN